MGPKCLSAAKDPYTPLLAELLPRLPTPNSSIEPHRSPGFEPSDISSRGEGRQRHDSPRKGAGRPGSLLEPSSQDIASGRGESGQRRNRPAGRRGVPRQAAAADRTRHRQGRLRMLRTPGSRSSRPRLRSPSSRMGRARKRSAQAQSQVDSAETTLANVAARPNARPEASGTTICRRHRNPTTPALQATRMCSRSGWESTSMRRRRVWTPTRCWGPGASTWRPCSTRIPHLAQTSDAVNRQLSCFSSRYMNLLAVFQI